jgi:ABC-type Na+ efflux pump permease subunit
MTITGIDYFAILAAAVAAWLVGAVWYMALGKPWMAALGKTREELMGPTGKPSTGPFIISFVAELVMAFVLAFFIVQLGPVTLTHGIATAFLAWLGFVATSMVVNHGFGGARPTLTVIDGGHWLAVLLVEGAVIGAFGS